MDEYRTWKEFLDEELQDPSQAAAYLTACMEGGDPDLFLNALRNVARARGGGVAQLARDTNLNREHLYRMLSKDGNPCVRSLGALLDAMGLQLTVTCKQAS